MLDLHVPAEVSLQIELTGAVRTLEGLVASMEMHMAQQVVHSVERLATYLKAKNTKTLMLMNKGIPSIRSVLFTQ